MKVVIWTPPHTQKDGRVIPQPNREFICSEDDITLIEIETESGVNVETISVHSDKIFPSTLKFKHEGNVLTLIVEDIGGNKDKKVVRNK